MKVFETTRGIKGVNSDMVMPFTALGETILAYQETQEHHCLWMQISK